MQTLDLTAAAPTPQSQVVYTVSQLNNEARLLLEECFHHIWITGEISNLSRPSSGHWYFSLKDANAQIRCAFFRNYHQRVGFIPENGQQVLIQARVSVYETRGDYQLIVRHLALAGAGALQAAFEQLKQRLAAEGLFSIEHKKSLPLLPRVIGVITSPTGAAIRDILQVLQRRFPAIPVIIYPTAVQGEGAAAEVVAALKMANRRKECEVLLLARGGGSLEDLWPFNTEIVARAMFASRIPIITGIGHEIDVTIADFVADQRAPTPSAAAEQISPDCKEWSQQLLIFYQRLQQLIRTPLRHCQLQLQNLSQRLQHPGRRLQILQQQLDQLEQRFCLGMHYHLQVKKQTWLRLAQTLQTLSPLATLQRGYAIIQDPTTQKIIYQANDVKLGDLVTAQLSHGKLICRVKTIDDTSTNNGSDKS